MGRRIVDFNLDLLAEMVVKGWTVGGAHEIVKCIEGVPPDAKFSGLAWTDMSGHLLRMEFEHPEWQDAIDHTETITAVFQRELLTTRSETQP